MDSLLTLREAGRIERGSQFNTVRWRAWLRLALKFQVIEGFQDRGEFLQYRRAQNGGHRLNMTQYGKGAADSSPQEF
jgi:hypothetical protein